MSDLTVIEARGIRVLTTKQIAKEYAVQEQHIKQNFANNRKRFIEGKHYISLQNQELREFKSKVENFDLVGKTAKVLYLWTEKGALLHAKSLNTDTAWEVYDYLVDFYFRVREGSKETKPAPVETKPVPATKEKGKQEELPQIDNPIGMLNILLKVAEEKKINVKSYPFRYYASQLHGNVIGIKQGVTVEKACYELAWELAHVFIHYDCGDMVKSPFAKDYNEQAARAAKMIIKILNIKMNQI